MPFNAKAQLSRFKGKRAMGQIPRGPLRQHRHALRDEDWDRIKEFLPGRAGQPGVTAKDSRRDFDSQAAVDKFEEKDGGGDPDPRDLRRAAGIDQERYMDRNLVERSWRKARSSVAWRHATGSPPAT